MEAKILAISSSNDKNMKFRTNREEQSVLYI